ncbi:MAG: sensor histidine kinase [Thermoleophilia bacterium]|nr:sensor histidine kinase [Thermoleophilia bacterium]
MDDGRTPRDSEASTREAIADAREATADAREAAADARDVIVDARAVVAEARKAQADTREEHADSREQLADEREDLADSRQALADDRQEIADDRDVRADERQVIADDRELMAGANAAEVAACIAEAAEHLADADARVKAARARLAAANRHVDAMEARETEALALRRVADEQMATGAALLADAKRLEGRLLTKLVAREELLTTMVVQQMRVREAEHRRIANDLHDSALQHSVAAMMFLDLVPTDDPAVRDALAMVRNEVTLALGQTRKVMQGLDPLELGEMTFDAAIHAIASDLQVRFGTPVEVANGLTGPVDDLSAAALCRMVSEALVNAVKHADPTTLHVSLGGDADHAWVAVHDDGCGIEAAGTDRSDLTGTGLGLAFLKERAVSLGGVLDIESDGDGTTIRMSLPRTGSVQHGPVPALRESS